jgi:hypothetical protein
MKWHKAVLDILARLVHLNSPLCGKVTLHLSAISRIKASLYHMVERKLEEIHIVQEFPNVFPDDLPGDGVIRRGGRRRWSTDGEGRWQLIMALGKIGKRGKEPSSPRGFYRQRREREVVGPLINVGASAASRSGWATVRVAIPYSRLLTCGSRSGF